MRGAHVKAEEGPFVAVKLVGLARPNPIDKYVGQDCEPPEEGNRRKDECHEGLDQDDHEMIPLVGSDLHTGARVLPKVSKWQAWNLHPPSPAFLVCLPVRSCPLPLACCWCHLCCLFLVSCPFHVLCARGSRLDLCRARAAPLCFCLAHLSAGNRRRAAAAAHRLDCWCDVCANDQAVERVLDVDDAWRLRGRRRGRHGPLNARAGQDHAHAARAGPVGGVCQWRYGRALQPGVSRASRAASVFACIRS